MRNFKSANTNSESSKVFDIDLLKTKPFELSRLQGFVDGEDDIFDVLSAKDNNKREQSHM